MNGKEFTEFKNQVEKDIEITVDNIQLMIIKTMNLNCRYLNMYSNEKKKLKVYEYERDDIYKKVYEQVKFHGSYKLDSKYEIEVFMKCDPDYKKAQMTYDAQVLIVDYLKEICDMLSKRSYLFSNYIDLKKIEFGIV